MEIIWQSSCAYILFRCIWTRPCGQVRETKKWWTVYTEAVTCAFTTNFSHVNSCIYVCALDFLFVTIYVSSLPEKASTRDPQLTTVPCQLTPSYARKFPYLITPSNLLPPSSAFRLPWQPILSLHRTTDYRVPAVRDLSTFNLHSINATSIVVAASLLPPPSVKFRKLCVYPPQTRRQLRDIVAFQVASHYPDWYICMLQS